MNKHGVILKFSIITPWNKQKWFKVQLKTVLWCDSTTQQVLSVCVFVYFIICIYIQTYIYTYIFKIIYRIILRTHLSIQY